MSQRIVRFRDGEWVGYGLMDSPTSVKQLTHSPFDEQAGAPPETVGLSIPLADVQLLAPVALPRIFGVGLNYASHAKESGQPEPKVPMLFMKPSTSVIGPDEAIVYPPEGQNVHYEAEVAVVIGKRARRISEDEATSVILGYTCGNDVSERVIQKAEMDQRCLLVGKGFDTFNPLGPAIVTDLDPAGMTLVARLNGEEKQRIETSDLIFSIPRLVSYLSQAITLLPGDVIMSGTPAGVGPMVPGDTIEIEIEGVGVLSNPVVAEGV